MPRDARLDQLSDAYTYRVFPNQSCDDHLEGDEIVYPQDSLESPHDYIEMGRDECLRFMYRDGRIPEWIDISVGGVDYEFTMLVRTLFPKLSVERLYERIICRFPGRLKSSVTPLQ